VLEIARGLTEAQLEAIEELEAACGAVDGGRLKLEYPTLRSRPAGLANDFLWVDPSAGPPGTGKIVGFLGIYQNRADEVEICGMVHPERRRSGIFSRLLDEARAELRRRQADRVLLIVDRSCGAGVGFAESRGATVAWSEYRMRQSDAPAAPAPDSPLVTLRPGRPDEGDFIRECLGQAFGLPDEATAEEDFGRGATGTLIIEHAGERVGMMRAERDPVAGDAGIYGFAVRPELQGRGYGKAALLQVTRSLRDEGIGSVHLEVLVDNPAALGLYEKCGFVALGIEDYYLLPG
jgi:ribosomal protein S18 acetylase RimI-like enzyme